MLKKSILILVMTDNSQFSQNELQLIKSTWAKPVLEGEYPNITFYSYTAMDDRMLSGTLHKNLGTIDNVCDTVFVPTDDDIYSTYKKTYVALKTLEPIIKRNRFDYIFKTDLMTYVNVPLLDEFVQNYINDGEEVIYTGKIKSSRWAIGPKEFCLFADRSSMLIPVRPYFNVLTQIKYRNDALRNDTVKCSEFYNTFRTNVDENAMGFIIDNYLMSLGRDHYEYYRDWNIRNFDDIDEDLWHKQIVLNIRHCSCRECEFDDHQYVHDVISDYYLDGNKPDLSYIENYMYSKNCPKIHVVDENIDSEEYHIVNLDTYKEIFKKKSLSTGISSGNKKPTNTIPGNNSNRYPDGAIGQCYHYSYLDYFNIPHHHIDNCPYHYINGNVINYSHDKVTVTVGGRNLSASDSRFDDEMTNSSTNWSNAGTHVKNERHCSHCNCSDEGDDKWFENEECTCKGECKCHEHLNRPERPEKPTEPENPSTSGNGCVCTDPSCNHCHPQQPEEPEDPSTNVPDVSVNPGDCSCDCCHDDDVWCNCVCNDHKWWHDLSTGDGCPCCSTNTSTNDPSVPVIPVDPSTDVPDVPSSSDNCSCPYCEDDCSCGGVDVGEIGRDIYDLSTTIDSLLEKKDETKPGECPEECSCHPADAEKISSDISSINDILSRLK